jgi:hypothetical protein
LVYSAYSDRYVFLIAHNVLQLQEVGDYESDRRSGTKLSATTKFDTNRTAEAVQSFI